MTCRELIEFLADYEAGELPDPDRLVFDRHLAACPACRAYLDNYRKTIILGREAFPGDEEPAPGLPEELLKAILAARRKSQ